MTLILVGNIIGAGILNKAFSYEDARTWWSKIHMHMIPCVSMSTVYKT